MIPRDKHICTVDVNRGNMPSVSIMKKHVIRDSAYSCTRAIPVLSVVTAASGFRCKWLFFRDYDPSLGDFSSFCTLYA